MPGIVLEITGTWITDPDTGESVVGLKVDRTEQDTLDGQVRDYAGRAVATSTTADDRKTPVTLTKLTEADVEKLRSWRGKTRLLRDGGGWRRWGVFFDLQASAIFPAGTVGPGEQRYRVQFTWQDTSHTEGV